MIRLFHPALAFVVLALFSGEALAHSGSHAGSHAAIDKSGLALHLASHIAPAIAALAVLTALLLGYRFVLARPRRRS